MRIIFQKNPQNILLLHNPSFTKFAHFEKKNISFLRDSQNFPYSYQEKDVMIWAQHSTKRKTPESQAAPGRNLPPKTLHHISTEVPHLTQQSVLVSHQHLLQKRIIVYWIGSYQLPDPSLPNTGRGSVGFTSTTDRGTYIGQKVAKPQRNSSYRASLGARHSARYEQLDTNNDSEEDEDEFVKVIYWEKFIKNSNRMQRLGQDIITMHQQLHPLGAK